MIDRTGKRAVSTLSEREVTLRLSHCQMHLGIRKMGDMTEDIWDLQVTLQRNNETWKSTVHSLSKPHKAKQAGTTALQGMEEMAIYQFSHSTNFLILCLFLKTLFMYNNAVYILNDPLMELFNAVLNRRIKNWISDYTNPTFRTRKKFKSPFFVHRSKWQMDRVTIYD